MILSDKQRKLLLQYVTTAEKCIAEDDIVELELVLDEQILEIGIDENFKLNNIGLKLQMLYDQIYKQN